MATGFRQFDTGTQGAQISGTTPIWDSTTAALTFDGSVVGAANTSAARLEMTSSDRFTSIDSIVDNGSYMEIVTRFKTSSVANSRPVAALVFAGSTAWRQQGYVTELSRSSAGAIVLRWRRWEAGSAAAMTSTNDIAKTIAVDTWYGYRARIFRDTDRMRLYSKVWEWTNAEGNGEPAAWDNDVSTSANTLFAAGGHTALGGQPETSTSTWYEFVGWATAGETAPMVAPAGTPLPTPVPTATVTNPTSASATDGSVVVSWPAVTGAATYDVEVATGLNQTTGFTILASGITQLSYTHPNLGVGDRTYGVTAKP